MYSCLLWCCKCVIGIAQQKHLEIAYAPLVTRNTISQQHVYKLCIGIDLVNDNQHWIVLINSATTECSLTQFTRCTYHGQTKIQLQLWICKTSCRQHPVPTRYLYDGLEHIPPWFKPIHMICFFLLLQIAPHYTQTTYTYDLSITLIRSQAQGCLTTKNLYIWQAVWV